MDKMSPQKISAFLYHENGWNIFPIKPGTKEPLAQALQGGSQNATLTSPLAEEDIERIWTEYPEANIGVHTGEPSQIAVIDIDIAKSDDDTAKGKRTADQALVLTKQFLATFGETQVHRSPSGGYHLIYKYTPLCEGIGRKIDAFKSVPNKHAVTLGTDNRTFDLSSIDVLAGKGYIVAPPSKLINDDVVTEYTLLDEVDLADIPDFPEELIQLIQKRDKVVKTYFDLKAGTAPAITKDNVEERKRMAAWDNGGKGKLLKKLQPLMGAGKGQRHDALMKTCGTVFAMLPYSEWHTHGEYINMVISTFSPQYFQGSPEQIDADKREVRNAVEYAKANEYSDRIANVAKHEATLNEMVVSGLQEVAEMGREITEEQYKEQVEEVFASMQRDNNGNMVANDYNIAIILRKHPKYKNRVRYDAFKEQMTYLCRVGSKYQDHYLDDNKDNPALSRLVQDIQFEFFPKVPRISVYSAAVSIAHDSEYDSYRESMDKLIGKWDGVPRLELWLTKMFKCPDDLYHRGVSAQFIFAMVRRAYEPGAEFQKVLFLSGQQGTGKSYSMRILAGNDCYMEFNDEIAGREFNLHAKGKSLIDLAEGEAMHRSSARRIKALISDNLGIHRTFGSGEVKEHPVRYVMSITNNESPLVDNTGNRRFLVVNVPLPKEVAGDHLWLRSFRGQIFAEAVYKYHKMKEMLTAVEKQIQELESEAGGEELYNLYKQQQKLKAYEQRLTDFGFAVHDITDEEAIKAFRTDYDVPYIPQEASELNQSEARMRSVIENEIEAVLMSYDEWRAGKPSFFITAEDVVSQIDTESLRQSRMGSFALSEVSRLITVVDTRLEKYRARSGEHLNRRGFKFKEPGENCDARYDAIKRLRSRASSLKPMPPSQFGGGSKAVTLEQKAARIRYEREGDSYFVFTEADIQTEITVPSSVDVSALINQDDF